MFGLLSNSQCQGIESELKIISRIVVKLGAVSVKNGIYLSKPHAQSAVRFFENSNALFYALSSGFLCA